MYQIHAEPKTLDPDEVFGIGKLATGKYKKENKQTLKKDPSVVFEEKKNTKIIWSFLPETL